MIFMENNKLLHLFSNGIIFFSSSNEFVGKKIPNKMNKMKKIPENNAWLETTYFFKMID